MRVRTEGGVLYHVSMTNRTSRESVHSKSYGEWMTTRAELTSRACCRRHRRTLVLKYTRKAKHDRSIDDTQQRCSCRFGCTFRKEVLPQLVRVCSTLSVPARWHPKNCIRRGCTNHEPTSGGVCFGKPKTE